METISIDMYQTLAIAVVALIIGEWIKTKINFLERFCIPSPVVGGLVFAIITCILYVTGVAEIRFDETLKTFFMVAFFASVGFQANVKVLKAGGKGLIILMVLVLILTEFQNGIAIGVSHLVGIDPRLGLGTGSIALVGGPGTAAAFGPVIESMGVPGATTVATAAATFGLVAGSLVGGPLGNYLVKKKDLLRTMVRGDNYDLDGSNGEKKKSMARYAPAVYQLSFAMGLGTLVSWLLSLTGFVFPVYIGSMIVAAIMRNVCEYTHVIETPMDEIEEIGDVALSLFLGIAMISLELWLLADLAIPLLILLACQIVFMMIFARYAIFNAMGRDYDAAVLTAGSCGFGLGATPNAMANMQAITDKYGPSVKAFLLVPIIGSMYSDFVNSISITFFLNLL